MRIMFDSSFYVIKRKKHIVIPNPFSTDIYNIYVIVNLCTFKLEMAWQKKKR